MTKDLSGDLFAAARRFAQLALDDFEVEDWDTFVLHAGTSLELLGKSYLSKLHPALIVSGTESLLYACQVPGHAAMPTSKVRTVGLDETIKRCGRILPTIENLTRGDLIHVIDARNGVAHMGGFEEAVATRTATAFFRASQEILSGLDRPIGDLWEKRMGTVLGVLEQASKATGARVKDKIKAAKIQYNDRFRDVPDQVRDAMIASVEESYVLHDVDETLFPCPVCGNPGHTAGAVEPGWVPGEPDEPELEVTFYPYEFRCRICGLAVDGEDEIQAAGLPDNFILEDVDPEPFLRDMYLDE